MKPNSTTPTKTVYIFYQTGEFVFTDWNSKEIDEETIDRLDLWPYTGIVEVTITPEEWLNKLNELLANADRLGGFGDDMFFDGFPDAIDMTLQYAAVHDFETFKDFFWKLRNNEIIRKFYLDDEEETLHEYLKYNVSDDFIAGNLEVHYQDYLAISTRAYKLF